MSDIRSVAPIAFVEDRERKDGPEDAVRVLSAVLADAVRVRARM